MTTFPATLNLPITCADSIAPVSSDKPLIEIHSGPFSFLGVYPAGSLISGGLQTRQAIVITADIDSEGAIARAGHYDEESYGETLQAAVNDLVVSLSDRLGSLSRREDRLSAGDKDVLTRLRNLFEKS